MLFISVILFGQDILSLAEPVHFMLPVRQSWSIASELLFYLTVPLIFRGHRFIMLLVGFAALMLCKYLLMTTYGWRYSYFLPVGNLGYFLLGGSLYYVSQLSLVEKLKARLSSWRNPLMLIFILFLFFFGEASFERGGFLHHFIFVFIFAVFVVFLFEKSISRFDAFFGNISYGLYLNHFAVICVATFIGLQSKTILTFSLFFSVMLAFLIERYIQRPIDKKRSAYWQEYAQKVAG